MFGVVSRRDKIGKFQTDSEATLRVKLFVCLVKTVGSLFYFFGRKMLCSTFSRDIPLLIAWYII